MTAVVGDPTPTIDISSTSRVPFGRLVAVEIRKMWDTRAGFWLLTLTAGLILLAFGIPLLVLALTDETIAADVWGQIMTAPVSLLVPVLAITSITSEWSQRTGLVSFTLEPHRMRLVWAKFVTVLVLALGTVALAIALGALGTVVGAGISGSDPVWNMQVGTLVWSVITQAAYFTMAFAFGLVLLSTPAAIAVYYIVAMLLPLMVYGTLYAFFEWAQDIIPWIDLGFATAPYMGQTMDGSEAVTSSTTLMQVIVTIAIWVVLPFVIGLRRVTRAELK